MTPGGPDFSPLVGPYLARQPWAQATLGSFGEASLPTDVVDVEILRHDHPGMASVVVESRGSMFHLVLGWRAAGVAPGVLGTQSDAVLGAAGDATGEVLVYAALADAELVVALFEAATSGAETARRGRVVQSLVSHSSLVYDDKWFMKCYRVIEPRPRPEVEMVRRLSSAGFTAMLAPAAYWQRHGRDLGLVRQFVPGAVEGLSLAHTSLRDLLARGEGFDDVGRAGGDLAPEMRRLGATTAAMHLALAAAFGPGPDAGSVRLHGDYHLRRVMRTDGGWLVAGFGDDPLMGAQAGSASQGEGRFGSPLEDVADLCCSLRIAAVEAVALQSRAGRARAETLAARWCDHNISAFVTGYLSHGGIGAILPAPRPAIDEALGAAIRARSTAPPTETK